MTSIGARIPVPYDIHEHARRSISSDERHPRPLLHNNSSNNDNGDDDQDDQDEDEDDYYHDNHRCWHPSVTYIRTRQEVDFPPDEVMDTGSSSAAERLRFTLCILYIRYTPKHILYIRVKMQEVGPQVPPLSRFISCDCCTATCIHSCTE